MLHPGSEIQPKKFPQCSAPWQTPVLISLVLTSAATDTRQIIATSILTAVACIEIRARAMLEIAEVQLVDHQRNRNCVRCKWSRAAGAMAVWGVAQRMRRLPCSISHVRTQSDANDACMADCSEAETFRQLPSSQNVGLKTDRSFWLSGCLRVIDLR